VGIRGKFGAQWPPVRSHTSVAGTVAAGQVSHLGGWVQAAAAEEFPSSDFMHTVSRLRRSPAFPSR
jgi:hypothetical protein